MGVDAGSDDEIRTTDDDGAMIDVNDNTVMPKIMEDMFGKIDKLRMSTRIPVTYIRPEGEGVRYVVRTIDTDAQNAKDRRYIHVYSERSDPQALPFLTFSDACHLVAGMYECDELGSGSYNTVYAMENDEAHVLRIPKRYTDIDKTLVECKQHLAICAAMPKGRVPRLTRLVAIAYYDSDADYGSDDDENDSGDDDEAKSKAKSGDINSDDDPNARILIAQIIERVHIKRFPFVLGVVPEVVPSSISSMADTWARQFLNAAVDICDAQVYHGDINEGNLVMSTGGVKLFDFDYDSCIRNAAEGDGCSKNATFGYNNSAQVEAPESICSIESVEYFSKSYMRGDLWRARDVICVMSILASRYPPSENPFHAYNEVIGNDVLELVNRCIANPEDPYQLDKNAQNKLLALMERLGLAYAASDDACDYYTMRRSGCFESAQIFAVAMNLLIAVYGGTIGMFTNLDTSLRMFSPSVANILLRCLHPMPMKRIRPDRLREELGRTLPSV